MTITNSTPSGGAESHVSWLVTCSAEDQSMAGQVDAGMHNTL